MVLLSLNDNTELAIFRDLEVKAPKGQAIKKLIELIKAN